MSENAAPQVPPDAHEQPKKIEQQAGDQHTGGRGESPDIVGQAAAGSPHASGKQFGQIEGKPAKEQGSHETLCEHNRMKGWF
mgnify:CR=1 FL=1